MIFTKPASGRRTAFLTFSVSMLVLGAVLGHSPSVAPATAQLPRAASTGERSLAWRMAVPWVRLQRPSGEMRDYLDGIVGLPGTRYGSAAVGVSLLQVGIREHARQMTRAGIRAIDYSVFGHRPWYQVERPSVFEEWFVAEAYCLGRANLRGNPAFMRDRVRWARWLRRVRLIRLPIAGRYGNHWLVEANAVSALLRTGLHGHRPGTVLGGGRRPARQAVHRLVDERIPRMARRHRLFIASDPPDNPPAYHALSLALYARLVSAERPRPSRAARRTLSRMADAAWTVASPSGDIGYFGRSQGLVWVPAATAYGAQAAARLARTGKGDRYSALAGRAIGALEDGYRITRRGQLAAPVLGESMQAGRRALDGYAGAPSMDGLALFLVNLAVDDCGERSARSGRLAADRPLARAVGSGSSRFAVVRHGPAWFAVKLAPSAVWARVGDLRNDFGLVSAQRLMNGRWADAVPLRPRTRGRPRDSAGPVLHARLTGYPFGRRFAIRPNGTVLVRGGYRTGRSAHDKRNTRGVSIRGHVTFRYDPLPCGVRMSWAARRGDRFTTSWFFESRPRRTGARTLTGGGQVVRSNTRFTVRLRGGYASARRRLTRADLAFRASRRRVISVAACAEPRSR